MGVNRFFVKSPVDDVAVIDLKLNVGSINEENPGIGNVLIPLWRSSRPYLELEKMGVSISLEKSFDFLSVRIKTIYDRVNKAVKLMEEFLTNPNMEKLDDAIREARTWNQVSREDTATRAFSESIKLLFGNHPYSRHPMAYEYNFDLITRDTVAKALDRMKVLSMTVVAREDTVDINIPQGDYEAIKPVTYGSGTVDLKMSGKVQTTIAMAYPAPELTNLNESFTTIILNTILGGMGLVSRLYREVRVKRGLAYYAYSTYIPLGSSGILIAMAGVRRENVNTALGIMQETINDLANTVGEDEVEMAIRNRIGRLKVTGESPEGLASLYSLIPTYKLPSNYYELYIKQIKELRASDVLTKARQIISNNHTTAIIG